jgi:C_GCAxxG_C_C family probable redox protein
MKRMNMIMGEIGMTKSDEALTSFKNNFTCSSAVFSAFAKELGLDDIMAKKIACGFGAGISQTGNICGAVSGAVMVIGLKFGKEKSGDDTATEKTRSLVRQFMQQFIAKNGSVNCTELLGYDLSNPVEYDAAKNSGVFITTCFPLVKDATNILERILNTGNRF